MSFYKHRWALARRPIVYAAACGFVLVASFYLMRNVKAYGSPFYSYIAPQLWLEKWRDFWALQLTPAYKQRDLLLVHGDAFGGAAPVQARARRRAVHRPAGLHLGMLFQNQVARVFPGIGLLVLAGMGLRRRWREGRRVEVVAVGGTLAVYFAALSLAASGMNELQVRYVVPYIAILIPYAVHETLERLWPWLRAWIATRVPRFHPTRVAVTLLALFFVARFALAAPAAFAKNPRNLYEVPPRWHETSLWLSQNLRPGERFAMPYQSYYSTWDVPLPDTDTRWPFWYGSPAEEMLKFMRQEHVRKAMIDRESAGFAEDRQKLSAGGRRSWAAGVSRLAALLRRQRDAQPVSGVLPAPIAGSAPVRTRALATGCARHLANRSRSSRAEAERQQGRRVGDWRPRRDHQRDARRPVAHERVQRGLGGQRHQRRRQRLEQAERERVHALEQPGLDRSAPPERPATLASTAIAAPKIPRRGTSTTPSTTFRTAAATVLTSIRRERPAITRTYGVRPRQAVTK